MSVSAIVMLLTLFSSKTANGSNILFLSPITAPSHSNFFKPVVNALVDRGHSVTFWNGLKPQSNLNQTNLRLLYSPQLEKFNIDHEVKFQDRNNQFQLFFNMANRLEIFCKAIYQDPIFHQLMNTKEKYDLIIVEAILNDCVLPLIRILDAPLIYMNGIAPTPWLLDIVGSPLAIEHFPNPGLSFTDEMNLHQRVFNTISTLVVLYFRHWFMTPVVDRIARDMLGDNLTNVKEIESHYLSLLIINTHFSINYQIPTSSAVIEAGGLHCVPPQPLPHELESFVDGSGEDGFIVVSFGSILKGNDIPDDVRRIFLSTFARLSQRVLWKWEETIGVKDEMIPANVKMLPWLPQQDLLGHSKVRLFITHGGLFSNQEAVFHGVPLIVLPVFADQPINAQKAQDDGYAIRLDWDNLNEEILFNSIQIILKDPRYKEKIHHVSTLMRDQMDHPLDRVIYWVEYVIRYQGAPHLRTASRKLWLYQRGLLDVTFIIFTFCLLVCYLIFRLCRSVFVFTTIKSSVHNEPKKKLT
ncbi:UDP-glucosyltransferase 2-like [Daphnia carinata]|uniref:UDP-glucosyltransferase 2-like n=1 Tax=Daphnia carinata TaxID=120202 RepID=UPI00257E75F3|nr:UDP-glucosyltransferase 2-like [Daphnia carinata]